MKIIETGDGVTVNLNNDELIIINNALNEVCNGVNIEDFEFQTRLGFTRDEVRVVLEQISQTFKK